jgi:hypothetical protein
LSKLRRHIIVLALCLAAVLTAKVYVNRFLAQRAAASGGRVAEDIVETPAPVSPSDARAGAGLTVEAPASAQASAAESEPPPAGALRDAPIATRPGD